MADSFKPIDDHPLLSILVILAVYLFNIILIALMFDSLGSLLSWMHS